MPTEIIPRPRVHRSGGERDRERERGNGVGQTDEHRVQECFEVGRHMLLSPFLEKKLVRGDQKSDAKVCSVSDRQTRWLSALSACLRVQHGQRGASARTHSLQRKMIHQDEIDFREHKLPPMPRRLLDPTVSSPWVPRVGKGFL